MISYCSLRIHFFRHVSLKLNFDYKYSKLEILKLKKFSVFTETERVFLRTKHSSVVVQSRSIELYCLRCQCMRMYSHCHCIAVCGARGPRPRDAELTDKSRDRYCVVSWGGMRDITLFYLVEVQL